MTHVQYRVVGVTRHEGSLVLIMGRANHLEEEPCNRCGVLLNEETAALWTDGEKVPVPVSHLHAYLACADELPCRQRSERAHPEDISSMSDKEREEQVQELVEMLQGNPWQR